MSVYFCQFFSYIHYINDFLHHIHVGELAESLYREIGESVCQRGVFTVDQLPQDKPQSCESGPQSS